MQILSATYQHTTAGFPKVKLKIHIEGDAIASAYITVKGVIRREPFELSDGHGFPVACIHGHSFREALDKFDAWVRHTYSEDATVQG